MWGFITPVSFPRCRVFAPPWRQRIWPVISPSFYLGVWVTNAANIRRIRVCSFAGCTPLPKSYDTIIGVMKFWGEARFSYSVCKFCSRGSQKWGKGSDIRWCWSSHKKICGKNIFCKWIDTTIESAVPRWFEWSNNQRAKQCQLLLDAFPLVLLWSRQQILK